MFGSKKKMIRRRCLGARRYVQGIDDRTIDAMTDFLLQDKKNRITLSKRYMTYMDATGAAVAALPIVPLAGAVFDTITLSARNAQISTLLTNGAYSTDTFGRASADGTWTNNNNNNNNNNG